jgi:hypothetical protein
MKKQVFGVVLTVWLAATIAMPSAWADETSQQEGRPVQQQASRIEIVSVRSPWTSDFDYGLHRQGSTYFKDCLSFVNRANVPVTHVQFVFAAVDTKGRPLHPLLPLDLRYAIKPNALQDGPSICREQGYGNGERDLWLAAWVSEVDYSDGTSWHAPDVNELIPSIEAALPHE